MKAVIESRPENMTEDQADRLSRTLVERIKLEAERLSMGNLVELEKPTGIWEAGILRIRVAIWIADETGTSILVMGEGSARLVIPDKPWSLWWDIKKSGMTDVEV